MKTVIVAEICWNSTKCQVLGMAFPEIRSWISQQPTGKGTALTFVQEKRSRCWDEVSSMRDAVTSVTTVHVTQAWSHAAGPLGYDSQFRSLGHLLLKSQMK